MTTTNRQYYLVVRPVAGVTSEVKPYVIAITDALKKVTGLQEPTLLQRLTGSSLQILTSGTEREALSKAAKGLTSLGIPSVVIGKDEIKKPIRPLQCKALRLSSSGVTLLCSGSNREVRLDKRLSSLVVLSGRDFEKLMSRHLAASASKEDKGLSDSEALSLIFRGRPFMDLYIPGSEAPIRIDSERFNYNSLGSRNRLAAALNFPEILKVIQKSSRGALLDTGFGENKFPFLDLEGASTNERLLGEFTLYSRFIFLASARGIFNPARPEKPEAPALTPLATTPVTPAALTPLTMVPDAMPVSVELGGMLLGGPLLNQAGRARRRARGRKDRRDGAEETRGEETEAGLRPPPVAPTTRSFYRLGGFAEVIQRVFAQKRFIHSLGPQVIIYPVILASAVSLVAAQLTEDLRLLLLAVLGLGIGLFTNSFVQLKRKRTIENCPTSNIGTMAMGEVEVLGKVRQKYLLRSPFTHTDCVAYSYKIYSEVRTKNGCQNVLKEMGSSGDVPFYIEDDSGRTVIDPKGAIISAWEKNTVRGSILDKLLSSSPSRFGGKRKVVESVIPAGRRLYIIGYAHRVIMSAEKKKRGLLAAIRRLKADKTRLASYDTDSDGRISQEEWARARQDVHDEVLKGTLDDTGTKDDVAIGEHPSGGLFYISDSHEEGIIGSISWKAPLFFVLGVLTITTSAYYIAATF